MDAFIPTWFRNLLIVALAAWLSYQLYDYGRDVEAKACAIEQAKSVQAAYAEDLAESEANRAQEGATNTARSEAADAHSQAIQTLVAQRNAAGLDADRLRQQVARTVASAASCTARDPAAEQSRAAIAALGAVFGACVAEYQAVAAEAGERHATGIRTEAEYDALMAKP
jgi:hypothetical protein